MNMLKIQQTVKSLQDFAGIHRAPREEWPTNH